jgi:hypothetical protein
VLELGPGDVAVIAALPVRLQVRREGERVWLTTPSPAADEQITLALADSSDLVRSQRPFSAAPEGFSLAEATGMGRYRAVLKLTQRGLLQDLLPLPELASLDLSEAAEATGAIQAADRDPRSVNGARPGAYSFNWDDPERWVQLTWPTHQTFNASELRCTQTEYSPQKYTYLTSPDGQEWRVLAEVNREGKPDFNVRDALPTVTTRFLRLHIHRGGPWGDHTAIVRWRVRCRPDER